MKDILVTGGSGFLGKELLKYLIQSKVKVVARNEGNLIQLKQDYPEIEIITGNIRDSCLCKSILKNVKTIYHLAAYKHVGLAETYVNECVFSNVIGTQNLLNNFNGDTFLAISTDKAAQVTGVYGATKLLMERLIKEYEYRFPNIKYRVVRYGNVLYSTGSVLCKWKDCILKGRPITVTEPEATRFFWTIEEAITLIFDCLENAKNSIPYCPEMKSIKISDLLAAMFQKYGEVPIKIIGLQPGENLHEKVLENGKYSNEVIRYTLEEILERI